MAAPTEPSSNPAVKDDPTKSGKWIPLESNPEVMNAWAEKLGLATKVNRFEDVYGLDDELLSMVPSPSKAVILCFPITEEADKARTAEDAKIAEKGQHALDPRLVYIKQTIGNACGTIGLLHALANSDVTIKPLSPLAKFFEEIQEKSPEERATALEKTTLFADAHVVAANLGQSAVPDAEDDTELHFVAFVQASSGEKNDEARIVELDGRRAGPVDHGRCKNFLNDVANVIRSKYIQYSTSHNFGVVSLGPPAP